MAIVFMVFFFIHCGFTLSSADYFIVAGVLYALSWCYSQMKTYFDHGFHNRATITRLSPRCLRVDIPVGPLTLWRPGQHMFLRFLTLGTHHALTAHPFTICSLPDHDRLVGAPRSVMTFYVKPRGGFTGRLAAIAAARGAGGAVATLPVLMEGAYGGLHGKPLTAYDRALVVACGSGAGFSLPFAMEWISAAATAAAARDFAAAVGGSGGEKGVKEVVAAPKAPRKMTIVIVTRDTRILQWYEAALSEFLESQNLEMPEGALEIKVYQTSETDDPEDTESDAEAGRRTPPSSSEDDEKVEPLASSSSTSSSQKTPATSLGFKTFTGRPDLAAVVRDFTLEETGSVGMAVCGPSSVLAAVRDEAAAAEMRILKSGPGAKEVYLYSEMFGW
ncbi:hypothetical protein M406DRAFT_321522 [Cryphonectria parasitica EP155]|uniref:ferric-chelate reductase (NADPH) n=1 Tax=Cryphonectria parasitica (strain ATCC 38755 / EP155) TaxID=660469 RepID=A0A9P4Y5H2_CRYP1|nr:uncharacterized protein M406DRAFT_321522 [Cryphonectria parasitica EP155]KAF3767287.1 hypothetical protein M406DRAFT_321522 [Cryphonectria parasitica EP155]